MNPSTWICGRTLAYPILNEHRGFPARSISSSRLMWGRDQQTVWPACTAIRCIIMMSAAACIATRRPIRPKSLFGPRYAPGNSLALGLGSLGRCAQGSIPSATDMDRTAAERWRQAHNLCKLDPQGGRHDPDRAARRAADIVGIKSAAGNPALHRRRQERQWSGTHCRRRGERKGLAADGGCPLRPILPLPTDLAAVVVPHHGADMGTLSIPPSPVAGTYNRLIYSFGPGNAHGKAAVRHPTQAAMDVDVAASLAARHLDAGVSRNVSGRRPVLATASHPSTHNGGIVAGWTAPPPAPPAHVGSCPNAMPVLQEPKGRRGSDRSKTRLRPDVM